MPDVLPECLPSDGDLLIRRWVADDAEALGDAIAESLDALRPWLPWTANEPLTIAQRRDLIQQWTDEWVAGGSVLLGAFSNDHLVGASGMHRRLGPGGIEFGYWVRSSMQGRGLATRIAWMLTDAALALDGTEFVEIHHDKANRASEAIPRKLGYTLVREIDKPPTAPGEIGIELQWRMQRDVWSSVRDRQLA